MNTLDITQAPDNALLQLILSDSLLFTLAQVSYHTDVLMQAIDNAGYMYSENQRDYVERSMSQPDGIRLCVYG